MVSTWGFDPQNPGSNPGRASFFCFLLLSKFKWREIFCFASFASLISIHHEHQTKVFGVSCEKGYSILFGVHPTACKFSSSVPTSIVRTNFCWFFLQRSKTESFSLDELFESVSQKDVSDIFVSISEILQDQVPKISFISLVFEVYPYLLLLAVLLTPFIIHTL